MDSKQALIEMVKELGQDEAIGKKLYGAAVKMSARYNVPLDDMAQDIAETAMDINAVYGYINVNIVCKRAKNAIFATYRYGVNQYYSDQGVSENSVDAHDDDADGNSYLDAITFDTNAIVGDNLSEEFAGTFETLSEKERALMTMLAGGWNNGEVAQELGVSNAYVSIMKKKLREKFSWAIA